MSERQPTNLEGLLQDLSEAAQSDAKVTVDGIMDAIGRRSFGPLLLLAGLLGMSPVAAVPTVPTLIAVITVLVAAQLLIGRKSFWLPKPMLRMGVKPAKVRKTVEVAQKPARVVDRLLKRRLQFMTKPMADRFVALVCILLAMAVPPLELLPFAAFIPSAAIAMFGLGLIARDGLLVAIAFAVSASVAGLAGYQLLN